MYNQTFTPSFSLLVTTKFPYKLNSVSVEAITIYIQYVLKFANISFGLLSNELSKHIKVRVCVGKYVFTL